MMILTFCYFQLQISSFKRQRLGESKKTGMYKYAIFVSFLRKEKNRLQPNEKFLSSYKFRVLRMSWKKSVRNGTFSPHEEEKNCFFAAFSFYFPVFRRQEFTDRMWAVPPRRFHRKKKEAEDGRFPFAFVL